MRPRTNIPHYIQHYKYTMLLLGAYLRPFVHCTEWMPAVVCTWWCVFSRNRTGGERIGTKRHEITNGIIGGGRLREDGWYRWRGATCVVLGLLPPPHTHISQCITCVQLVRASCYTCPLLHTCSLLGRRYVGRNDVWCRVSDEHERVAGQRQEARKEESTDRGGFVHER